MFLPPPKFKINSANIEILVKAICDNSSIAYLGAGVSMSAGLPGWEKLISDCINRIDTGHEDSKDLRIIRRFHRQNNLPLCAELLQIHRLHSTTDYIEEVFANEKLSPTQVHHEIARIPFSFVFTTNYDRLMESAYEAHVPQLTWKSGEQLYEYLRKDNFAIIKLHGTVEDSKSIILTKSQYSKIDQDQSFTGAIETVFSFKTILFIGSSLRDPDLQRFLEQTRSRYGSRYGPHFAIMFDDETDDLYSGYLWDIYKIASIILEAPRNIDNPSEVAEIKTQEVSSFLRYLSGRVAEHIYKDQREYEFQKSNFNLRESASSILKDIVSHTGSDSGIIVYTYDSKIDQLSIAADMKQGSSAPSQTGLKNKKTEKSSDVVSANSFWGSFFLESHNKFECLYIPDVRSQKKIKRRDLNFNNRRQLGTRVHSLLACPIHSRGELVGLLVLESHKKAAFSKYHCNALKAASHLSGYAYSEYKHREHAAKSIAPYLQDTRTFCQLMNMSRQLALLKMSYILWEIDYVEGTITAHTEDDHQWLRSKRSKFTYHFSDHSLATNTLHTGFPIFIDDASKEIHSPNPRLAEKGVEKFKIKGPIYSLPIRVEGRISSILVAWSKNVEEKYLLRKLTRLRSRIFRLAHLITNDPDRDSRLNAEKKGSYFLLEKLNNELAKLKGTDNWNFHDLYDVKFRRRAFKATLQPLVESTCKIRRVRLWFHNKKTKEFQCVYSYSASTSNINRRPKTNQYKGYIIKTTGVYSQYILDKAQSDPFARHQHSNLFGRREPNTKKLDKDPKGTWIIAPIVSHDKSSELLGYIAADNHCMTEKGPIDRRPNEKIELFQKYALDLAADLLVDIFRSIKIDNNRLGKVRI